MCSNVALDALTPQIDDKVYAGKDDAVTLDEVVVLVGDDLEMAPRGRTSIVLDQLSLGSPRRQLRPHARKRVL
jgi:hypothetical protein